MNFIENLLNNLANSRDPYTTVIEFPGLFGGIGPFEVCNIAFYIPIGQYRIPIAWYALIITFGIVCCLTYLIVQARKIGVTMDDIIDGALFVIPIGILGARLYYVAFDFEHYDNYKNILDVIDMSSGGLAIYGGIIFGTLTVIGYCMFKRINFLALGDCIAPGVLLAQGIGRWGNFMNGEAFGYKTEIFCRMGIENFHTNNYFKTTEMVYVHPTFLYESLWNLLGVLLVYLFQKFIGKKYDGQLIYLIFGWYGFGRMFIEALRTDSLGDKESNVRVSLILGAVIFAVCLFLLIFFAIKKPKSGFYFKYPVPEGTKLPKISFKERVIGTFYTKRTEENAKPIDYKPILAAEKARLAAEKQAKLEGKHKKEDNKNEENEENED